MVLIEKDSFHIIPLTKGNIHETKVQVKTEVKYQIPQRCQEKLLYVPAKKQQGTTKLVIKGLRPEITPEEISGTPNKTRF